jgi:CPA1 family monovalent cation:H+ antiporter
LRGSLAVIMVLLIPDDLSIPGWTFDFTLKQFIADVTIGSIYFTLLIKATTIGKVMHALGIDALTPEEQVGYHKSKAQMYDESLHRLNELFKNHLLNEEQYQAYHRHYQKLHQNACNKCKETIGDSSDLIENMLRIYAVGIEKDELKEIFLRGEITEKIYKKILTLLTIQTDRIEHHQKQVTSANEHFPIDDTERFVLLLSRLAFWRDHSFKQEELYLYYRTLNKLIRRVIEKLTSLGSSSLSEIFDDKSSLERLIALYQDLHLNTEHKMQSLLKTNPTLLDRLNRDTAELSLHAVQMDTISELHKNEIITSKLYIMLNNELQEKSASDLETLSAGL